jgi:hypothetical protein
MKKCKDCNKEISNHSCRCASCAKKGKLNPNYKNGLKSILRFCIDCGKQISTTRTTCLPIRCRSCDNKTRHHSEKTKEKMSKTKIGMYDNQDNPNWQGGIGKLPYAYEWTESLREEIRDRDNHECQVCNLQEKSLKGLHKKLPIHHIDYDKMNSKEENLITLCNSCNIKANYNRDYWFAYFTYKIKEVVYACARN